ncbi:MAG: glutamine-hydrolyzing carbamoyl-phosphate synthase small subunit [Candidatus Omnitrophota bacterium]|jgi:carbamoyl-phosphate synthase small subunit
MHKAKIALEDGTVFEGTAFGAGGESFGEIVFNTGMTGYQEVLTDPSYKSQIVVMTYPLSGNYGINPDDSESRKIFLEGFVVRECSQIASNWQAKNTLSRYLEENGIIGIEGVDTRALTLRIRSKGAMKAVISTECLDDAVLIEAARSSAGIVGRDLVSEVTNPQIKFSEKEGKYKVVVIDCGLKYNILRELTSNNCSFVTVPSTMDSRQILGYKPQGVLISNGPGDPQALGGVIDTVRQLIGKVPLFGICLGHQILGLALGGKTYKLKFGHHGCNHPVEDLRCKKISITSQNHGFCLDPESLDKNTIEITHKNLNDNTIEGFRHTKQPVFSVQFHPERCPGPNDAGYLFGEFIRMMEEYREVHA